MFSGRLVKFNNDFKIRPLYCRSTALMVKPNYPKLYLQILKAHCRTFVIHIIDEDLPFVYIAAKTKIISLQFILILGNDSYGP